MKITTLSPSLAHLLCMSLRTETLGNAGSLHHFSMTKIYSNNVTMYCVNSTRKVITWKKLNALPVCDSYYPYKKYDLNQKIG